MPGRADFLVERSGFEPVAIAAAARFGDRLHPLEVDLRRRFHQQLHNGDPAPARDRRAASGGLQRGAMIALNALASLYSRAIASFGIVNLTE